MVKEQKELLAEVAAAEKAALKLYNSGVKIGGVFQKLRTAREELETRVRYLEKNSKPAKPAPKKDSGKAAAENPKS